MFIIVQALDSLSEELKNEPIDVKMGHVLKSAGVSITVTSLTDVAAFAIGATTVRSVLDEIQSCLNDCSVFFSSFA